MNEKYKIQEKVNLISKNVVESIQQFDDKHHIVEQLNTKAKSLDEQYKIVEKVQSTLSTLKSNGKVQLISTKVLEAIHTIEDISKETQQLLVAENERKPAELNEIISNVSEPVVVDNNSQEIIVKQ